VTPGFIDSDGDNAFAGGDLYKDTMVNGKVGKKVRGKNVPEMLEQVHKLVLQAKPGSSVMSAWRTSLSVIYPNLPPRIWTSSRPIIL